MQLLKTSKQCFSHLWSNLRDICPKNDMFRLYSLQILVNWLISTWYLCKDSAGKLSLSKIYCAEMCHFARIEMIVWNVSAEGRIVLHDNLPRVWHDRPAASPQIPSNGPKTKPGKKTTLASPPLNPHTTIVLWWSEGFRGVLNWAHMITERCQSLGQLHVWPLLFFQQSASTKRRRTGRWQLPCTAGKKIVSNASTSRWN